MNFTNYLSSPSMEWSRYPLEPVGVIVSSVRAALAEQIIRQYLQNISVTSYLDDMSEALCGTLVDAVGRHYHHHVVFSDENADPNAGLFWTEKSLAKWTRKNVGGDVTLESISLL